MQPTRDDITRYVLGDISEVGESNRIESALRTDAEVARWYEEILAEYSSSAEATAQARQLFGQLDRSIWVRVQFQERAPSGHSPARQAKVKFPDGREQPFTATKSGDLLKLEFEQLPRIWFPASVVLLPPKHHVADLACLFASEFKRIVGHRFQSLPLYSEAGGLSHSWTLTFSTEAQARLWEDSRACQMIRFEPRQTVFSS